MSIFCTQMCRDFTQVCTQVVKIFTQMCEKRHRCKENDIDVQKYHIYEHVVDVHMFTQMCSLILQTCSQICSKNTSTTIQKTTQMCIFTHLRKKINVSQTCKIARSTYRSAYIYVYVYTSMCIFAHLRKDSKFVDVQTELIYVEFLHIYE